MDRRVLGILLVVGGLIVYFGQQGTMSGDLFFFILTGGLVLGYVVSGFRTGLLVAGSCSGALAIFVALSERSPLLATGFLFFLLFGLAFLVVFVVEYAVARRGRWALYPGFIITAFSAFVYVHESPHISISAAYWKYWPVLLIIGGLLMLYSSRRR
ncbi:MAG: hypothetical protein R6U70_00905 [Bacillota bacterium]